MREREPYLGDNRITHGDVIYGMIASNECKLQNHRLAEILRVSKLFWKLEPIPHRFSAPNKIMNRKRITQLHQCNTEPHPIATSK